MRSVEGSVKELTFEGDFEAINVSFADVLLDKEAIARCDALRFDKGYLWPRHPINLKLGVGLLDSTGTLDIPHIHDLVDTTGLDGENVIGIVYLLGDNSSAAVEIAVRDNPGGFSFETER